MDGQSLPPIPRSARHSASTSSLNPSMAAVLGLQRSVGNAAVAHRLTVQRCGPTPCNCSDEERSGYAADHPDVADGFEQAGGSEEQVQRQVPAPAAAVTPPSPPAPATTDPNPCPDPAEQAVKEKFRDRTDMKLVDFTPSPGLGKFNAAYLPKTSKLAVTVKLHFQFTDDASAPTGWSLLMSLMRGQDLSRVMWDEAQRKDYISQFTSRVHARWSGAHTIRSIKPCWVFSAVPDVNVGVAADPADAHYLVKVHKSVGPGIDYQSIGHNENLLDPTKQPTADFWQSDNREEPNFNSGAVARTERQRIEAAITAAGAARVLFAVNTADPTPAGAAALTQLASALNAANPSAPLIPLIVQGLASAEGARGHNLDLSRERGQRVADVLAAAGVRQPVNHSGGGPVGAPRDPSNRAATIAADTAFESTYASNRYSVSEHEFGHMLGLPDEYSNATSGPLVGVQTKYTGLVTSAGLAAPTFGEDTSSQMSNGVDVLPRHYVTLWEALAKMTAPDLGQADWRIG